MLEDRPARQNGLEKAGVIPGVIADPGARIRFYLHKEFRAAEIGFYLHKEFRAANEGDVDENDDFHCGKRITPFLLRNH